MHDQLLGVSATSSLDRLDAALVEIQERLTPGHVHLRRIDVPVRQRRKRSAYSAQGRPSALPTLISLSDRRRRRQALGYRCGRGSLADLDGARQRRGVERRRVRTSSPVMTSRSREGGAWRRPSGVRPPSPDGPPASPIGVGETLAVADHHESRARRHRAALAKPRRGEVFSVIAHASSPTKASSWRNVRHSMTRSQ